MLTDPWDQWEQVDSTKLSLRDIVVDLVLNLKEYVSLRVYLAIII